MKTFTAVEILRHLPTSERKIVTKETHQGCLSFAITGFSELHEVLKNRTQLVKKVFLTSWKFLSALLAALMLLSATACAAHEPVLPPVRESQYPTHSILAKYYDFQEVFQEADVVAHIRIGDWLGENIDCNATLFQAEPVDVFKGALPDTFVYDQFGCSRGTEAGYPLYSCGNEILAFLHKETIDGTEVYLNLGVHTTEFLVIQADSGDYYCDRNMGIGAGLDCPVMDRRYREDVLAKAVEQYPLPLYTYEHARIFDKQTADQWMHQFAREVIANEG